MKHSKQFTKALFLAALFVGSTAMAQSALSLAGTQRKTAKQSLVKNISQADNQSVYSQILKASSLSKALSSKSSVTILVPSNAAFDAMENASLKSTLKNASDKEAVNSFLSYNILPGKLTLEVLTNKLETARGKMRLKTFNGDAIEAYIENGEIMLRGYNGATVRLGEPKIGPNGNVIYSVDKVLLPSGMN